MWHLSLWTKDKQIRKIEKIQDVLLNLNNETFFREYSAWSAILMRIHVVKFRLAVACFAVCDITSVFQTELDFIHLISRLEMR